MSLKESLDTLEQRLEQLLAVLETQSEENRKLRQAWQDSRNECTRLRQKNTTASQQIEGIITRLKPPVSSHDG
ncbi:MAG: hypothetical protein KDI44_17305 [Thiothrix sp.]|nr:hypothetical protein [Thiothrix sp.]HPQ96679.1 hypothetical protein [Thiolinea sp.]